MKLILAFDIGTSSMRTSLFTASAERIASTTAQESYPLTTTPDGGAEFPPELLREAALRCLDKTFEAKRSDPMLRDIPIIGVGTSCFWHSLVGVGKGLDPLTPVITWADARCRRDAVQLRNELDERAIHRLTGCMLRPSFWPAKLAWLRRTQPEVYTSVQRWISPAEWLQEVFCGTSTVALGMATGTGLFNPTKCDWEPAVFEFLGLDPSRLNRLSDEPQLLLAEKWGNRYPELVNVPWYPGIGDGAASNLGSGATQPGVAAINMGTSAALRVMTQGEVAEAPFGLFCYRVDRERFLVGGAVSNAGNLRAWCLKELRLPEGAEGSEEIEAALSERPLPKHGLTVLPFWTAERAPTWREEMTGGILGLQQHTTALDLLQATTEAVFYRLARIEAMVTAQQGKQPKLIVSGGILRSPSGLQRLANVIGAPVYPNEELEASIRGAAVYVAEKLGLVVPASDVGAPLLPDPEITAVYRDERRKQGELEELLCERFY